MTDGLAVVGLFAGIGGIEQGLAKAGHHPLLLSENLPEAAAVLKDRFAVSVVGDVRQVDELPEGVDVVSAGFPCQDLSSVGRKSGIEGTKSRLVGELFRLLQRRPVDWVIVENVPFLLHLNRGNAMKVIADAFTELGYAWAYRVVDTEGFGLPQRRRRLVIVASRAGDPREVLFADVGVPQPLRAENGAPPAYGFYWTEGTRALGWAVDAVPPIKGGSSIGVPSPPCVVLPDGTVGTPDLRDAERLQGFPAGWTEPAETEASARYRWRLVGNAVSVPVAAWIGSRLSEPGPNLFAGQETDCDGRWPNAAYSGGSGTIVEVPAGPYPVKMESPRLSEFLDYPLQPLSRRATVGFLSRYRAGTLRQKPELIAVLEQHLNSLGVPSSGGSAA